jgi:hypothetical protein
MNDSRCTGPAPAPRSGGGETRRRIAGMAPRLGMILLALGCGGDENGTGPTPEPTTAAQFTQRGWTRFEAGDLAGASSDFGEAIDLDAGYAPAYVGQGWTRLSRANTSVSMQNAVSSFDDAIALGSGGAEVRAGRAAANLGAGGTFLAAAVADARAAWQTSSGFVFSHRTSFDVKDLHLIEAFAQAGQADFEAALAAADAVTASGIQPGDGGTWVVSGVTYVSFEGAVLAHLHRLSQEHAG